jgi:hypothetical protein
MRDTLKRNFGLAVIFAAAVVLRAALSYVNFEANDPHWQVSEIIMKEGRLPDKSECFECFQPKLYHGFVAQVWKTYFPSRDLNYRIKVAQWINAYAGILTILIVWMFLARISVGNAARLTAFSLIALNPCLIAINAQATNDSFAILFATAALYCLYFFFVSQKRRYFWGLAVFAIFTALSKGTGLVLFVGVVAAFAAKFISLRGETSNLKKSFISYLLIFMTLFFTVVPVAGEYYLRYQRHGSPFVTNKAVEPPPHLFKETYILRPGTTSIAGAFFTFRLVDLLKHPFVSNDFPISSPHRTSLWSQLYGRTHFVFFDQWPPMWYSVHPAILNLGRLAFLLALLPTMVLLLQLLRNTVGHVKALLGRDGNYFVERHDWIFDLVLWLNLLFIVYLNYLYRDFSWMKSIYIFPALLCATYLLAKGFDSVYNVSRRTNLVVANVAALLLAYVLIISALIYKLGAIV